MSPLTILHRQYIKKPHLATNCINIDFESEFFLSVNVDLYHTNLPLSSIQQRNKKNFTLKSNQKVISGHIILDNRF